MQQSRAIDWFSQADEDLRWGQTSLGGGHFSQTCFIAQQVAGKAAKVIEFQRGAAEIRGHSVLAIVRELGINGELETAARRLDQYYIPSRYPDAQPAGAPFEFFTADQAREALDLATAFVNAAREEVTSDG